jgi:hypothetical protein
MYSIDLGNAFYSITLQISIDYLLLTWKALNGWIDRVRYLSEPRLQALLADLHTCVTRSLRSMRLRAETAEALARTSSAELAATKEQYRTTAGQLTVDEAERMKKAKVAAKRDRDQALRVLTDKLTKEFDEKQKAAVAAATASERSKGGSRAVAEMEAKLRAELKAQAVILCFCIHSSNKLTLTILWW